jgi:DNA-directed RNA polymerase specialized sigma24 family protein
MQDGQSTDEQLLEAHVARHDEAAFAELVRRHVNLVYGTALRILGDPPTAEEVTQNVFITLARKAGSIGTGSGLAGWLHRAAILEARLRQRTDLRRRNREEHAAQLGTAMDRPSNTDPLPSRSSTMPSSNSQKRTFSIELAKNMKRTRPLHFRCWIRLGRHL